MRSLVVVLSISLWLASVAYVQCFAFGSTSAASTAAATAAALRATTTSADDDEAEWTDLTDDGAVRIRTITPSPNGDDAPSPATGDQVSVDYVGTLAPRSWSAADVVAAWLPEQQGLDALAPKLFVEFGIDGDKLTDEKFFTEQFVTTALAVDNKIKCKKLCMAARNLNKEPYAVGNEFDSSQMAGKPFAFALGKGKADRGGGGTSVCYPAIRCYLARITNRHLLYYYIQVYINYHPFAFMRP